MILMTFVIPSTRHGWRSGGLCVFRSGVRAGDHGDVDFPRSGIVVAYRPSYCRLCLGAAGNPLSQTPVYDLVLS